jgi:hypothetical protein
MLALASGVVGGPLVSAQEAPTVGVDVPYVDAEGITRGTVQVREIGDPFTELDLDEPPLDDRRFVGLIVAFTAADDQTLEAHPNHVRLHDADGHLWHPASVPRPADAAIPDLEAQTMAPGNRISGFVGFVVPVGVGIDAVVYQPDSYRAIILADLAPGAGPAAGSEVPFTDEAGGAALLTAVVDDPVDGSDPDRPTEPGTRYVGLRVAVENVGDRMFPFDPYDVLLRDAAGHLYYSSYVPRLPEDPIPDLEAQRTAPGDRISGFIGFVVPEDAALVAVDYQPESDRRVTIADLAGGGEPGPEASPGPSAQPAVTPDPAASAGSTAVPASPVPTPEPSAGAAQ